MTLHTQGPLCEHEVKLDQFLGEDVEIHSALGFEAAAWKQEP